MAAGQGGMAIQDDESSPRLGSAAEPLPTASTPNTGEIATVCAQCGAELGTRRVDAKFCTEKCRNKAYRQEHPRINTKEDTGIVKRDAAQLPTTIEQAKETKGLRDIAEAKGVHAKALGNLHEANQANAVRLQCEWALGRYLRGLPKKKPGGRGPTVNGVDGRITRDEAAADLNINSREMIARYNKIAKIEHPALLITLKEIDAENEEVSRTEVFRRLLAAHVGSNTGDSEWYTPPAIIGAARAAMGSIDLDPATSKEAQEVVKAGTFYTAKDNGLEQDWAGNVWLNPPYSQPLVGEFIDKMVASYVDGDVAQGVTLTNNATETNWGQTILAAATAVCFPDGRVKFWNPDRTSAPLQGQMLCYLGNSVKKFEKHFGALGVVLKR